MRMPCTLALRFLLMALPFAAAGAAPSSITVVCDDNFPPYAFRNDSGALQGIVVDQWKAWERATGVDVELHAMDWALAQADMLAGKADVIDTIYRTPEREGIYDFARPYASIQVPVFIHSSISGIARLEDLRGFRVGVKAGDAVIDVLAAKDILDIVQYPSHEATVDAAIRNDVRAFCFGAPSALYFLYKKGADKDFRIAFTVQEGSFHRAVRKGETELLGLVQGGFDSIPPETYRAIERTWLGSALDPVIDPARFRLLLILVASLAAAAILLVGIVVVFRQRVAKATAQLREQVALLESSEQRNRAFIAALPDLFFVFDREGRYLEYHTSSPGLLALPPERLLGKRLDELPFPDAIVARLLAAIRAAIDQARPEIIEYELEVGAGLLRFEGRVVPLGKDRALFVGRDITERARGEALLRASLSEKEVLLREIHHRVKNNLQIVSSLVALQVGEFRDPEDRELMDETQARIRAMARLHELLYRSRDLSCVDAGEYLESIAGELAEAAGVNLDMHVECLPITLDDAVPLGLIANELVTNALKYGSSGSTPVAVRLERRMGRYVLEVRDEGPGLPADFDGQRDGGMGFTLIRSLASQIGGKLRFSSPPGLAAEISFVPSRLTCD